MFVNYKIRAILGDIITKRDTFNRLRLVNNEPIKATSFLPDSEPSFGLTQVVALDSNEADLIKARLQSHKHQLGLRFAHIVSSTFNYKLVKAEPEYGYSVVLKVEPLLLLKSALNSTRQSGIERIRKQVLFPYESDIDLKESTSKRVVIDFSSPNIAKPFHYGHLRSTILGNFLANLNELLGNQVTRLNFIGDWGTQYGLLSLGLDKFRDHGDIETVTDTDLTNPEDPSRTLRKLLKIYALANELGAKDAEFYEQSRITFGRISQDARLHERWMQIRSLSLSELKRSYQDLGIRFDVFEFESDYANSFDFVRHLSEMGLIIEDEEGLSKVALKKKQTYEAPVLRSDGTSLYLTRDVAAAFDRKRKYNFDEMLYVVGVDQERHFHSLREIIKLLGHTDLAQALTHIKMGKVLGFSSRAGNCELLSDIIDKAREKFVEMTRKVPTSKVRGETDDSMIERVGHNLALSSLFVQDLRFPRKHHYNFDWTFITRTGPMSGVNLQATYARLCSLRDKASAHFNINQECLDQLADNDSELSVEAVDGLFGMNLISALNDFDNAIHDCCRTLDASHLIRHAFWLCNVVNRARQSSGLQILHEPNERLALTRLALFMSAREQLGLIIRMLGLVPLERV